LLRYQPVYVLRRNGAEKNHNHAVPCVCR